MAELGSLSKRVNKSTVARILHSRQRLISLLLFVLPCTVVAYIFQQSGLLARLDSLHLIIFLLILVLALAGIIVLRQAFEKFVSVSVFLEKAGSGETVQMELHHDSAELGELSDSFNRFVARLDEMSGQMESLHADLQEANAERRRAENSFIALKKAIDIMQLGVTITDETRRIVYVNEADARMHGYRVEELLGRDVRLFAPPEGWGSDYGNLEEMMSWKRESVNVRKDGSLFPVHLTSDAVPDAVGCYTGVVTTCEDITDKKRAEDALRESRQYLENIIQFFPDATMVIDSEGKITAWNRAMELVTGVRAEEMLGKGSYEYALPFYGERRPILIDLVSRPVAEIEENYSHIERHGDTVCGETFMPLLNIYLQGTATVLRDSKGTAIGAIEAIRDITVRKRIEKENERLIDDLHQALKRVKTLSGMLPICAGCKKIRDDKGYWTQLEKYISEHSDALFSHGYCPDCLRETYTEFEEFKKTNGHPPEPSPSAADHAGKESAAVEESVGAAGRIK